VVVAVRSVSSGAASLEALAEPAGDE
jgi:hypothetical protein